MTHQNLPLTEDENIALNSASSTQSLRARLYGRKLLFVAQSYAIAADAVGLRKDAAKYLFNESMRLTREGMAAIDHADELELVGK